MRRFAPSVKAFGLMRRSSAGQLVAKAKWLDPQVTLDDAAPLGPDEFEVRPVNPALIKSTEKSIEAIEAAQDAEPQGACRKAKPTGTS